MLYTISTWNHSFILAFPFFLFVTLFSYGEKNSFHLQTTRDGFRMFNVCPMGNNLPTGVQCLCAVVFVFRFRVLSQSIAFGSSLGNVILYPFREVMSCTQLLSSVTVHILPSVPLTSWLMEIVKICIRWNSVCDIQFMGFMNAHPGLPHSSAIQNCAITLRNLQMMQPLIRFLLRSLFVFWNVT